MNPLSHPFPRPDPTAQPNINSQEEIEEGLEEDPKNNNPSSQTPNPVEQIPSTEFVQIGEIRLGSAFLNAHQLSGLALGLLKEEVVKEYLEVVKRRKSYGGYIG